MTFLGSDILFELTQITNGCVSIKARSMTMNLIVHICLTLDPIVHI